MLLTETTMVFLDLGELSSQIRAQITNVPTVAYIRIANSAASSLLDDFLRSVRSQTFKGLLVIGLGTTDEAELKSLDPSKITLELVRFLHPQYPLVNAAGALALACKVSQAGTAMPIILSTDQTAFDHFPFEFSVLLPTSFSVTELLTLHGYEDRYYFPRYERRPTDPVHAFPDPERRLQRVATYEAHRLDVVEALKSFSGDQLDVGRALSFMILGALRVSRRLAACTLEGAALSCSILLTTMSTYDAHTAKGRLSDVIALGQDESVPFDFNNWHKVRTLAEIAQAANAVMVVDTRTGLLNRISVFTEGPTGRFTMFRSLAEKGNKDSFVIHARDGFVELFTDGQLVLWFDRFRWSPKPFATLARVLDAFFPTGNAQTILDFVDAIVELMDQTHGSIIVLLDALDRQDFGEVLSPMRYEFQFLQTKHKLSTLTVPLLASILHLDGAHIVEPNGGFHSVAQKIELKEPLLWDIGDWARRSEVARWAVGVRSAHRVVTLGQDDGILASTSQFLDNEVQQLRRQGAEFSEVAQILCERSHRNEVPPNSASATPNSPIPREGSGRAYALILSALLRNSWIIKVSAAGNLYIFRRGSLVEKGLPGDLRLAAESQLVKSGARRKK